MQTYINRIGWFIGWILIQVFILNHVHIFGYATPFLYIYFLLKLPTETSRNILMLWGFFLGLAIDTFCDTPGMNASAAVWLAFLRPYLLKLFMPRDIFESMQPAMRTMGNAPFVKYLIAATLLHHTFFLIMEGWGLWHWGELVTHIVACSLLTIAMALAIEFMNRKG